MNKNELLDLWKKKLQVITYRNLKYDIVQIQKWFHETILPHPPAWQGAYDFKTMTAPKIPINESGKIIFGGWSLLGPNKDYWTGWLPNGNLPVYGTNIKVDFSRATIRTELCTGIMNDIINDIELNGLKLSRARITVSKPGDVLKWHADTTNTEDILVRIQLPIIASTDTIFRSTLETWTMPSDGTLFIINTNHMHQVENNSSDIRFNLIADVDLSRMPPDDFYNIHESINANTI